MASINPVARAALWMTGAILSFSSMAVAGRFVASELDTFELLMYRSIIGVVIVLVAGGLAGTLPSISTRHMDWHLVRNVFHFAAQNLWYFALTVIPLAQVFALEFTSPLWVIALSPLILGERLTKIRVLAAIIGFSGILIVTRPFGQPLNAGVVAAALSAIGFAVTAMFTKRLTRSEGLTCILFWLVAMQTVMVMV
jgi:drug/metabolite transporter (DMT)-like permease